MKKIFVLLLSIAMLFTMAACKKEETPAKEKLSMKDITKAMGINPKLKETISMAEHILKRTLSQREITSVFEIMQEYSMSQEMILVLLEYSF